MIPRKDSSTKVNKDMIDTISPSLLKKINAVTSSINVVLKTGHNADDNYDYATAKEVILQVKKELEKQKLLVFYDTLEVIPWGTNQLAAKFRFYIQDAENPDERMHIDAFGQGSGDMALWKAQTGARKYFYFNLFNIAQGDDPEKSSKSKKPARASTSSSQKLDELRDWTLAHMREQFKTGESAKKKIQNKMISLGVDEPSKYSEAISAMGDKEIKELALWLKEA